MHCFCFFFPYRQTLKSLRSHLTRILNLLPMSSPNPNPLTPSPLPPFDATKPSTPISFPISDLADLESRSYFRSFHFPFNVASVPLPESAVAPPERRRMLVCHDMMGGYVDDKWVQGGVNDGAYAIWHWYLMDVFVYFSHSLVTVPPPGWTNAAHTHGVKVLGTFLAEWEQGEEICKTLLLTKESSQMYAERLTELAVALGFDGWLINMEVKLQKEQIANLKEFVNHLTQTMHSLVPGSLVIWYDSVTVDGLLDWQDQLNEKNKPFFDLCDGIFVNYTWKKHYPKSSAVVAGSRKYDVYMGIDVFGRKTYGGGEWNTNIALDLLKEVDVSAAIFAPGWVYENLDKADFQSNQNRWWGLVKQSWGILQSYPKALPFYSNFNQGHGHHFSIQGWQVYNSPWNNISCQGFQPLLEESVCPNQANMEVFINFEEECYSGGCNITCKGSFGDDEVSLARLFQGKLPLDDLPLHFSYSVKSNSNSQIGLLLEFSSNTNEQASILLADYASSSLIDGLANKFNKINVIPTNTAKSGNEIDASWVLHEANISMSGFTLTDIHIFCYMRKAKQNEPNLENDITITKDYSPYLASLGHISIKNSPQNVEFPPAESWSIEFEHISWSYGSNDSRMVSLNIIWKLKAGHSKSFTNYNIYVEKLSNQTSKETVYLGVAMVEAFYVSNLEVPLGLFGLRFIVQVCGSDCDCQELDKSPSFLLAVEEQLF